MAKKKVVTKDAKLKLFISHKHKDEEIAKKIVAELDLYAAGKIEFYLSEENPFGVNWHNKVHKELKEADHLFLLYTDASLDWDWCMYETGFFSRGVYDKRGEHNHRLICLHRPKVETPKNLDHWKSVSTTPENLKKLLTELYKDINKPFVENKKSLDGVIETIIEAFRPELKRRHFSRYIHICLDKEEIGLLTEEKIISEKAEIKSDEKSLNLFNLSPKTDGKWCWKDIQKVLTQSNQKAWSEPLIENMTNAYEDKEFLQKLPLLKSVNNQQLYHPILHRLDRMPDGISKFTVLFVPMKTEETKGMIGSFNMVLILLKIGHRFRWNIIEKYIRETRGIRSKSTINQTLADLDLALIKNESEAAALGVFTEENISFIFDEKDKSTYNKSIKAWEDFKKEIDKNISDKNLAGVKRNLREMRERNKEFMVFISEKYHELFKNLK